MCSELQKSERRFSSKQCVEVPRLVTQEVQTTITDRSDTSFLYRSEKRSLGEMARQLPDLPRATGLRFAVSKPTGFNAAPTKQSAPVEPQAYRPAARGCF